MHPRLPALVLGSALLPLLVGHALPLLSGGSAWHFSAPWDISAVLLLLAGGFLFWRQRQHAQSVGVASVSPHPADWSMEVVRRMDWKRFEDISAAYYPTTGIKGRALHLGETGGIDVRLYQDEEDPEFATAIVRCKSSSPRRVDVKTILELIQAMKRQGLRKAFYMCRAGFDEDAVAQAAKSDITLVDGPVLLQMILRLPKVDQTRLLDFATTGDWTTPTCPICNVKMAVRHKETKQYWRCPNAKTCDQRMKMVV